MRFVGVAVAVALCVAVAHAEVYTFPDSECKDTNGAQLVAFEEGCGSWASMCNRGSVGSILVTPGSTVGLYAQCREPNAETAGTLISDANAGFREALRPLAETGAVCIHDLPDALSLQLLDGLDNKEIKETVCKEYAAHAKHFCHVQDTCDERCSESIEWMRAFRNDCQEADVTSVVGCNGPHPDEEHGMGMGMGMGMDKSLGFLGMGHPRPGHHMSMGHAHPRHPHRRHPRMGMDRRGMGMGQKGNMGHDGMRHDGMDHRHKHGMGKHGMGKHNGMGKHGMGKHGMDKHNGMGMGMGMGRRERGQVLSHPHTWEFGLISATWGVDIGVELQVGGDGFMAEIEWGPHGSSSEVQPSASVVPLPEDEQLPMLGQDGAGQYHGPALEDPEPSVMPSASMYVDTDATDVDPEPSVMPSASMYVDSDSGMGEGMEDMGMGSDTTDTVQPSPSSGSFTMLGQDGHGQYYGPGPSASQDAVPEVAEPSVMPSVMPSAMPSDVDDETSHTTEEDSDSDSDSDSEREGEEQEPISYAEYLDELMVDRAKCWRFVVLIRYLLLAATGSVMMLAILSTRRRIRRRADTRTRAPVEEFNVVVVSPDMKRPGSAQVVQATMLSTSRTPEAEVTATISR